MTTLVEDDIEQVALDWLGQLDWQTAHGTDISDDVCGASMRVSPPCGYCLKASMTVARAAPPPLWIADQVRNDGPGRSSP